MNEIENTEIFVAFKLNNFLSGKSIWVWRIAYMMVALVIGVILYGAFYVLLYILSLRWWVGGIILAALAGFAWGTIMFTQQKNQIKK